MTQTTHTVLIQLTKSPILGEVKTRLISELGVQGAMELHMRLTRHVAKTLCDIPDVEHQLWSTKGGQDIEALVQQFKLKHLTQKGGDLGERLRFCIRFSLPRFHQVLLIGSDCPFLSQDIIVDVRTQLRHYDVVFVPAHDGGYVLVGVKQEIPELFIDIPWGSDRVLSVSQERLTRLGLTFTTLSPLHDIDRPEDLSRLTGVCDD